MKIPQQMALEAKVKLLAALKKHGVDEEGDLIIACVRKSRPGRLGYYSHMSQFRGKARIVVDPTAIGESLKEFELRDPTVVKIEHEVFKTISHEYGHIMAEAVRHIRHCGETFDVPDWQAYFYNNEEDFAEDFARFLTEEPCDEWEFWNEFMPRYASECLRLYSEPEEHEEITDMPQAA